MYRSIEIMKTRIAEILVENEPSIYLHGSVVLNDFRLGRSDIDILALTKAKISEEQANRLLNLRQELLREYEENRSSVYLRVVFCHLMRLYSKRRKPLFRTTRHA